MFGLFKSAPFIDPHLGELRRSRGLWRGTLVLGEVRVPLALCGTRREPDPTALESARDVSSSFQSWRPAIERALYEHYEPYAAAIAAGEADPPGSSLPRIDDPAAIWSHTDVQFVQVTRLGGQLTIEIGYRVAWDEEHTLGARLRDGQLVELCGSVLAP